MKKIAIFASGSGSNAENIILQSKFRNNNIFFTVFTNNKNAKVLDRAKNLAVDTFTFNNYDLTNGILLEKLEVLKPDLIVLAGFLRQIPQDLIDAYPYKIINIHPALLPKYGGKGMYGVHVHQAVLNNQELETGITVHYVNEHYDEGAIIFQKSVSISGCKSVEEIANKIHLLEMEFFPDVIFDLLKV